MNHLFSLKVDCKKFFAGFLCLYLLVPFSTTAFAEENAPETTLEEMVVTATRTSKSLESVPGSVSVITQKDIESRNVQSLDGVLKQVPGLYSRREGEFSTLQPVIEMRGIAGQNRTLILLDGITLNEPRTGAGYFDGIPVEDVERVEVVNGPFSSLYGGYAMGGVVNVITRMPEKREITVKSGYGTGWNRNEAFDDLTSIYGSYGDKFMDKLGVMLSYGRKETNGYPYQLNVAGTKPATGITGYETTTDNTGKIRYLIGDKGDGYSAYDGLTAKAKFDFTPSTNASYTFMRNTISTDYDSPNTLLRDGSGNPVYSSASIKESSYLATASGRTRNLHNLGFETDMASIRTKLSVGLVDQQESYNRTPGSAATVNGGAGTYLDSPAKSFSTDLQFTAPLFSTQILTWGGTFKNDSTDSTTNNLTNWLNENSKTTLAGEQKGATNTFSLFVQDEIPILSNLTAYLGSRMDWWESYDGYNYLSGVSGYPKFYEDRSASAFSPKASMVYSPLDATTLRASAGKAFRPPTIYELYSDYVGTYTLSANANLEPETSQSWDVGVDQGLWPGAKLKLAYFENYLDDLIYAQTISSTLQKRVNIGSAKTSGVELGLEQRIDKTLRIFGDFTYTDARVTDNPANPGIVGKQLVDVPDKIFNIGIEDTYGPLSGSLVGRYIGKRYSTDLNTDEVNDVYTSYDPFFTADAKITYHPWKYAALSLSVNNIFNARYYTYYRSPGTSWYCELTLKAW